MPNILLVDDDDTLRFTVQQMLELDGHQVELATNGQEGLDRFGQGHYDLVITDVLMPRMDGAQFIAELRRRVPHLPILAISGGRRVLTPEFNLQTANLAGATHQLSKPFGRAELRQAVSRVLGSD